MISKGEFEKIILNRNSEFCLVLEKYLKEFSEVKIVSEDTFTSRMTENMFKRGGYLSEFYKIINNKPYSTSTAYEIFTKLPNYINLNIDYVENKNKNYVETIKIASNMVLSAYNNIIL